MRLVRGRIGIRLVVGVVLALVIGGGAVIGLRTYLRGKTAGASRRQALEGLAAEHSARIDWASALTGIERSWYSEDVRRALVGDGSTPVAFYGVADDLRSTEDGYVLRVGIDSEGHPLPKTAGVVFELRCDDATAEEVLRAKAGPAPVCAVVARVSGVRRFAWYFGGTEYEETDDAPVAWFLAMGQCVALSRIGGADE